MTRVIRGAIVEGLDPYVPEDGTVWINGDAILQAAGGTWQLVMTGYDARVEPHRAWLLANADWPYTEMVWDDRTAPGRVKRIAWPFDCGVLEIFADANCLWFIPNDGAVCQRTASVLTEGDDGSGVWVFVPADQLAGDRWALDFNAAGCHWPTRQAAEMRAQQLINRVCGTRQE